MAFLATVAIYAAVYALQKIWEYETHRQHGVHPQDENERPGTLVVDEGRPIPLIYGNVLIESPAIVYSTQPAHATFGIGTKWFPPAVSKEWTQSILLILGIPGQGVGLTRDNVQLHEFFVGGKRVDGAGDMEHGQVANISKEHFFDADGSGLLGTLVFESGREPNTNLGHPIVTAECTALGVPELADQWPTYARQLKVLLYGIHLEDGEFVVDVPGFYFGSNISPPPLAFRIIATCQMDFGSPHPMIRCMITGDANPASVIYDILVGTWGRVGLPQADIDLASFTAVGVTLHDENHGYSNIIDTQKDAAEVLVDILAQIDGVLFVEPTTNQFHLKLIRDDYDVGDLITLDPSNIEDNGFLQYNASGRSQGYNEVRVVWRRRDIDGFERDAVVVQQDQAVIKGGAEGRIRSTTIRFPGIRDENTAAVVAARVLVYLSDAMSTVRIRCNRDAAGLRPGDAFVLTWPEFNIDQQVFRVQGIDFGTLEDRTITIDAARDRFDIADPIMPVEPTVPVADSLVLPLEYRAVEEAPRLFSAWTSAWTGLGGDDVSRGMYLALPAQSTSAGYSSRVEMGARSGEDMPLCPYLPTARVETAYPYTTDVYDTTTHLRITLDSAVPGNFFNYTGLEVLGISIYGNNLLKIDDEILGFETITDLGAGVYRLNNIWRGLLDTVADDHAVDAVVWLLSDSAGFCAWRQIGIRLGFLAPTADVVLLPRNGGSTLDPNGFGAETDRLTIRQRQYLPYTGADFKINGAKTLTLTKEGLVGTWKWRETFRTAIVRGDEDSDTLNPSVVFVGNVLLVKTPAFEPAEAEALMSATSGTSLPESGTMSSSRLGTGTMRALLRVYNQTLNVNSWADAFVEFEAPAWRNLLINGSFESVLLSPGWSATSGIIVISNDGSRHGDQGNYLRSDLVGDQPDIVVRQVVRLDNWNAQFMIFTLNFYEILGSGDVEDTDTYTVSIKFYDADDVLLSTKTTTDVGSAFWTRHTLEDYVPEDTVYAIVTITLEHIEEADPRPDVYVADFNFQVGQHTGDLAGNGNFGTGDLSGWTTATGSFTVGALGTSGWNGDYAARGGSAVLNELYQDVDLAGGALPGYVAHTDFEVRWAQNNGVATATDTGQVVIEARDSGGSVMTVAASPDLNVATVDQWSPGQLVLDLPPGTDHVRVRLISKRAGTGGTNGTRFTDIVAYPHKRLEIDERQDLDFRAPNVQRLPRDRTEWPEAFINDAATPVPIPDYGFYNGNAYTGQVGIEPSLAPTTGEGKIGKFVGCYDAERGSSITECYEFHPTDDGLLAAFQMFFPFGEFRNEQDFTMVCFIRKRTTAEAACGIGGRLDSVSGWSLQISSSGFIQAFVRGDSGTATATRANSVSDGAVHLAAIIYEGSTNTLKVVDEFGSSTASVAAIGDLRASRPNFCLGKAATTQDCLPGQIARCYLWRSALSVAQVQALFTQGGLPGDTALTSYTSPGAVCAHVNSDDLGHVYAAYGAAQIPQFFDGYRHGLPLPIAVTNIAQTVDVNETTPWVREHVGFTEGAMSPTGFYNALSQTKDNTSALRHSVTTANANPIMVVWWARSTTGGHNARVTLRNGSGTLLETHDYSVSTLWRRKSHVFSAWDFSTATAVFRFFASDSGTSHTVEIAGPVLITQTHTEEPIVVPYKTGSCAAASVVAAVGLTAAFNHEGEIGLEAMSRHTAPGTRDLATVDNATNDNDKRRLTTAGRFAHYNASGTENDSDATPAWVGDTPKTINARWQQAALLDFSPAALKYAGVYYGANSAFGRTAIFTATNTAVTRITLHGSNFVIFSVTLLSREGPPGATVPELP